GLHRLLYRRGARRPARAAGPRGGAPIPRPGGAPRRGDGPVGPSARPARASSSVDVRIRLVFLLPDRGTLISLSRDDQRAGSEPPTQPSLMARKLTDLMIGIGVFLLVIALLSHNSRLFWFIGGLMLLIGIVLEILGAMGRAVGG